MLPQILRSVWQKDGKLKHQDASPCTPTVWVCISSLIFTYSACTAYQISDFDTFVLDGCCYGYRVTAAYHGGEFSGSPGAKDCINFKTQPLLFEYFVLSLLLCLPVTSVSPYYPPLVLQNLFSKLLIISIFLWSIALCRHLGITFLFSSGSSSCCSSRSRNHFNY